jgi:hypothetical protein
LTPVEQRAEAILRRVKRSQTVAEIGVFHGQLSELLLGAGLNVVMVDNWLPGEAQSERYRATGDFHGTLSIENVARAESAARAVANKYPNFSLPVATLIKADSLATARSFDDKSFDMVFFDADHSYEGVKEDIHEWRPKVKPGGWIGGHDYGEPPPGVNVGMEFGVTEAVREMTAPWYDIETDLNMTWFVQI